MCRYFLLLLFLFSSETLMLGASDEFDRAFEAALLAPDEDSDLLASPGESFIPKLMRQLRQLGSDQDIGDASARVLQDPSRIEFWTRAMALTNVLGDKFDRSKIIAGVRDGLKYSFQREGSRYLKLRVTSILCSYGTEEDVAQLKRLREEVATYDSLLAAGMDSAFLLRDSHARVRSTLSRPSSNENGDSTKPEKLIGSVGAAPSNNGYEGGENRKPLTNLPMSATRNIWLSVGAVALVAILSLALFLKRNK